VTALRTVYRICPVHPSTAAIPNGLLVVEGYKYHPNHHNSKHPSFLKFPFNTRASAFTPRHKSKDQSLSKSPKSFQPPSDLRECLFVFFAFLLLGSCWGLVLKCYELRTRQHKMLMVKDLRLSKHYLPWDIMIFRRRL
jgi:hypothetical protein